MNLKRVKPLGQDEEFFHLQDEKEKPFKVAKRGLSAGTLQAIEQHFAEGGEVKPEESGWLGDTLRPVGNALGLDAISGLARAAQTQASPAAQFAAQSQAGEPAPSPAVIPAEEEAAPAPPPSAPPPTKMPHTGGPGASFGGPSDDDIKANANQAKEAERMLADMQRNQFAAAAAAEEASAKAQEEIFKNGKAAFEANLQARAQLGKDIENQKLDFNRYWSDSSAGGKIAASIGMILGGISQGMIGGQNQALQVIEAATNRDVEQQKAELGKKQNRLSLLMQDGHDIKESMQLLSAHNLAATAAQMRVMANRHASAATAPLLLKTAAEIDQKSMDKIEDVHERRTRLAIQGEQLSAMRYQRLLQGDPVATREAMLKVDRAMRSGAGVPDNAPEAQFLDPATTVATNVGGKTMLRRATTADEAKDLRKLQAATSTFQKTLQKMVELKETMKAGTMTKDKGATRAEALVNSAILQMHEISDITKMGPDVTKRYEAMIPRADATFWTGNTKSKFDASLGELAGLAEDKLQSHYNAHLVGGKGIRAGGGNIGRLAGQ